MDLYLAGKVALVTGAARGIGKATAQAFAREGASVILVDQRVSEGEETTRQIRDEGGQALFIQADITRESEVRAIVEKALAAYGSLDYAFNNAGVTQPAYLLAEQTEELYDHVMGINAKGIWLCMKHEISHMLKQGKGAIVNVSSTLGVAGTAGMAIYTASKHAILGLTRAAALDYARSGIRINAVGPGAIETPMVADTDPMKMEEFRAAHPLGRIGQAEEIANAVLWLCSDRASNVTGTILMIDGGFSAQ
ncbi:SDR family oxidoreductase [Ktedonosporobacter rubrisoli]|uniref:SDR family oxidoreductase n=1 Tax=Ktedonosporobacter rubrisoli TaxID=2509675 RepID=A0A4P6K0T3_KTERU|nr:SDR family oxidoreductase [Ktedonosporobacter rubrisoli]QBD81423.1 SDR family oxidoreductase [Ktedonosporobacter rubrisoli]